jgi:hypothetical protein
MDEKKDTLDAIKKSGMLDNTHLEELIGEMNQGWVEPSKQEEFVEEFKKSMLYLPVIMSDGMFDEIKSNGPGEISSFSKEVGYDINYLSYDGDKRAVPLFTSREMMESTGLESSAIVLPMEHLRDMLEQSDRYSMVVVNPYTPLDVQMPINSFFNLFREVPDEETGALKQLLALLKAHSIEVEEDMTAVFRLDVDIMKQQAIDGTFVANIPFKASSNPDFEKELKFTNMILIPKGKKVLYLKGLVTENVFDTIIAPFTEFELVDEPDEFTRVWKCGAQPFYDDEG